MGDNCYKTVSTKARQYCFKEKELSSCLKHLTEITTRHHALGTKWASLEIQAKSSKGTWWLRSRRSGPCLDYGSKTTSSSSLFRRVFLCWWRLVAECHVFIYLLFFMNVMGFFSFEMFYWFWQTSFVWFHIAKKHIFFN